MSTENTDKHSEFLRTVEIASHTSSKEREQAVKQNTFYSAPQPIVCY